MQPGTQTIARAFKNYGADIGKPYTANYNGKWGIGGTACANTPVGMGYDKFRGFWGDSIEAADGYVVWGSVPVFTAKPKNWWS